MDGDRRRENKACHEEKVTRQPNPWMHLGKDPPESVSVWGRGRIAACEGKHVVGNPRSRQWAGDRNAARKPRPRPRIASA
jgi:hypothetical protein